MKKNLKIQAFTLAEVLLTLVIIGVISVLTVPSLRNHSEEAKYVAATQKAMAEIAAATTNAELANGDASSWNFNTTAVVNYYKNTMHVVPLSEETSWPRYSMSGEESVFRPSFMTSDGMAWAIVTGGYGCGGGCALVDVNGIKPPNTIGVDIQGFRIGYLCEGTAKKGDFGVYAMGDGTNDKNEIWACTSYIIKHKKMPWLQTPTDSCNSYMGK